MDDRVDVVVFDAGALCERLERRDNLLVGVPRPRVIHRWWGRVLDVGKRVIRGHDPVDGGIERIAGGAPSAVVLESLLNLVDEFRMCYDVH